MGSFMNAYELNFRDTHICFFLFNVQNYIHRANNQRIKIFYHIVLKISRLSHHHEDHSNSAQLWIIFIRLIPFTYFHKKGGGGGINLHEIVQFIFMILFLIIFLTYSTSNVKDSCKGFLISWNINKKLCLIELRLLQV